MVRLKVVDLGPVNLDGHWQVNLSPSLRYDNLRWDFIFLDHDVQGADIDDQESKKGGNCDDEDKDDKKHALRDLNSSDNVHHADKDWKSMDRTCTVLLTN